MFKLKRKSKILAAAVAMMTLSTAAAVTGTVAWFTANNIVTASNMTVQAQAEQGIVIAAYTNNNATAPVAADFQEEVNASIASATMLPTWTNGDGVWYHANSTKSNNGQIISSKGYKDVSSDTDHVYYLYNKFQIKSTGATQDVWVKSIAVTRVDNTQAYDEAIRVLVLSGSTKLIFAPIGTHSGSETILASAVVDDPATTDVNEDDDLTVDKSFDFITVNTAGAKIMSNVAGEPVDVSIYIFFDGQDTTCKSDNIVDAFKTTTLNVSFTSDNPVQNP